MSEKRDNQFQWPVIGHHNIISYLQQSVLKDRVTHAYLFLGPEHIGKTTVAKNFIGSLVCENLSLKNTPIPCHQCQYCQQVENKIHPDILWLERQVDEKTGKSKKNISIEQIRELQNRLSLFSFLNSYKVAVINEAHNLSQEAANSLLKILEEPTPKTVLILLINDISFIPRTIISRCQVLKFLPVGEEEIFNHLISLKAERKKAHLLAALSYGRPGIAINYLTEPEDFADYQSKIKEFLLLHKANIGERFKTVNEVISFSDFEAARDILNVWIKVLRDLVLLKNLSPELVNNLNFIKDLEQLANLYNDKKLIQILGQINQAKSYLQANVNPRLVLENLILNLPVA